MQFYKSLGYFPYKRVDKKIEIYIFLDENSKLEVIMETAKKNIIIEKEISRENEIVNKIASTFEFITEDAKTELKKNYLEQTYVEAGGE